MTKSKETPLISDISVAEWDEQGPPILFPNPLIRKMLSLVDARPSDVFYDLGSGWGQNLLIALTEYQVREAVGIENDRERHAISLARLKRWGIPAERGRVICASFEKVLSGKVKEVDAREASIVFYGLATDRAILSSIERNMARGAKLVYYYKCLFPEIMPDRVDFPFFRSTVPFRRPKSQYEWLSRVVGKGLSSIRPTRKPSLSELWDELAHDYDVEGIEEATISEYRHRLGKVVG